MNVVSFVVVYLVNAMRVVKIFSCHDFEEVSKDSEILIFQGTLKVNPILLEFLISYH